VTHTTHDHTVAPSTGWDDGVLASLYEVAFAAPDREVAGVLVGTPPAGGMPPQIHAVIPAAEGQLPGQAAQFTHQTWAYVHQAMADHYHGLEVVGWYVSRPGKGTDLRDGEQANHLLWFSRGQQILLILDSRRHRGALYAPAVSGGRLVQLHEGPVARRYARPSQPAGRPLAALAILICLGILLGALGFIVVEAFSAL
jgi:proteasome lid subunit RPN8/RPN11